LHYSKQMSSCFLMLDEEDSVRQVNIDELYEKKKNRDLKQLSIFNKILNRIHRRITLKGKQKLNERFIWFQVPEYIFGEPVYDKGHCIAYLISKLEENGFAIRYLHPNTLFVNWENFVPSYMRAEIKRKTGVSFDEKGNVIEKKTQQQQQQQQEEANAAAQQAKEKQDKSLYTPIKKYKPTGSMVYDKDLFDKIEKKVSFV